MFLKYSNLAVLFHLSSSFVSGHLSCISEHLDLGEALMFYKCPFALTDDLSNHVLAIGEVLMFYKCPSALTASHPVYTS